MEVAYPAPLDIYLSNNVVQYEDACNWQNERVAGVISGNNSECIWLLQHPPMYTAGVSASPEEYLGTKNNIPVYKTNRGGRYTYHGPGQRIAYVILDLNKRFKDIHKYVNLLEEMVIQALASIGIEGTRIEKKTGVWVVSDKLESQKDKQEKSIAKVSAIGVRVRKWVTFHGVSINLSPCMDNFQGIVPCGIYDYHATSVKDILGEEISVDAMDTNLVKAFCTIFNFEQSSSPARHPSFP